MSREENTLSLLHIEQKIFSIRGMQVMLDSDLAELYGVTTGRFNEQVKRNIERFPDDFMFQLSFLEWDNLKSQIAIASWGGRRNTPYVFSEQGVAGLSGILKSKTAINIHIAIMRAFVKMRQQIAQFTVIAGKVEKLEMWQSVSEKKFTQIFKALETRHNLPETGIFFEGQVFDAWMFISDLIRSAKHSIVLIDNFVDDTVLNLFAKRKEYVTLTIYTRQITRQLTLEADKFNQQYGGLTLRQLNTCHDRFLIIDEHALYHIGVSLKDLGRKWFAFSKIDTLAPTILQRLTEPNT